MSFEFISPGSQPSTVTFETTTPVRHVTFGLEFPEVESSTTSDIESYRTPKTEFFRALTARYCPNHSLLRLPEDGSDETETTRLEVDWSRDGAPVEESFSDDEMIVSEPLPVELSPSLLPQQIYKATGKWEWINGLSIQNSEINCVVHAGYRFSIHFKTGKVGEQTLHYLYKSWPVGSSLDGFFSELALYKVQLLPLQGLVVPSIIGVYSGPGHISVALEAPHHSFWIQASPDMPDVLKRRCVEAFEKLHAQGVYHGDVKLSNILIGGDAKVTIINFHASRALEPNISVGVQRAAPAQLATEMRSLKYQLDYEDSRTDERQRLFQLLHDQRAREGEVLRIRIPSRYRPFSTIPDADDTSAEMGLRGQGFAWLPPPVVRPKRFIVPGQTEAQLNSEIERFLSLIERMEEEVSASTPFTMPPSPSPPKDGPPDAKQSTKALMKASGAQAEACEPSHQTSITLQIDADKDVQPPRYFLRKRKHIRNTEFNTRPEKKLRTSTSYTNAPESTPDAIDECEEVKIPNTSSSGSKFSIRTGHGMNAMLVGDPIRQQGNTPSVISPSPVAGPSIPVNHIPPIKVRDFAYEPHQRHGPPATRQKIIDANVRHCVQLGLPHPDALKLDPDNPRWRDPDILEYVRRFNVESQQALRLSRLYPDRYHKLPRPKRSKGGLKRALEAIANARRMGDSQGTRLFKDGWALGKRKREDVPESTDQYSKSDNIARLREGPKVVKLSNPSYFAKKLRSRPCDSGIRGILKNPRTRNTHSAPPSGSGVTSDGNSVFRSYTTLISDIMNEGDKSNLFGHQPSTSRPSGLHDTGVETLRMQPEPLCGSPSPGIITRGSISHSQSSESQQPFEIPHKHKIRISSVKVSRYARDKRAVERHSSTLSGDEREVASMLCPPDDLDVTMTPPYTGSLGRWVAGLLRLL